ncbi:MAG: hypothetical protein AB7O43_12950 [Hyphomicrobiaceae bacterium]
MRISALTVAAAAAALIVGAADIASAACTKLAFSVNDYGKEGPTKDAKNLLDKYIAKWTAERNIKSYRVGPKDVSCELFLNFIVFDEHTCKATASVCWDGPAPKPMQAESEKSSKAARSATSPVTTGSVKPKRPASGAN